MAKSLIRRRREAGAVCPSCRSPDYSMTVNVTIEFKPNIICGSCGNIWQYGYDGGVYAELYGKDWRDGPVDGADLDVDAILSTWKGD